MCHLVNFLNFGATGRLRQISVFVKMMPLKKTCNVHFTMFQNVFVVKTRFSRILSDEESQKRDHATCNLRSLCDDDGNGFSHHFKYEIAAFLQKDSYEAKEPNDDEK